MSRRQPHISWAYEILMKNQTGIRITIFAEGGFKTNLNIKVIDYHRNELTLYLTYSSVVYALN